MYQGIYSSSPMNSMAYPQPQPMYPAQVRYFPPAKNTANGAMPETRPTAQEAPDWNALFEQLQRETRPQPAETFKKDASSQAGIKALLAIKSIFAAAIVGGVASLMFGANPIMTIAVDAVSGFAEGIIADKMFCSKSPTAKAIINKLYQWRTGETVSPGSTLTDAQKTKTIAPLSAALSGISTIALAVVSYFAGDKLHGKAPKFVRKGLFGQIRRLGTKLQNVKILKAMRRRPLVGFAVTLGVGMLLGLIEGVVAEKLGHKHCDSCKP